MSASQNSMGGLPPQPYPEPDLDPIRLEHTSYALEDSADCFPVACELADTLEDHFDLARTNKLTEEQFAGFAKFVDNNKVYWTAISVIPEVAKQAGSDDWVETKVDGPYSGQITQILDSVAHHGQSFFRDFQAQRESGILEQQARMCGEAEKAVDAFNDQLKAKEDAAEAAANAPVSDPGECSWSTCSKPAKLRCAKCKKIYYCGKICQKSDWSNHKRTCVDARLRMRFQVVKHMSVGEAIRKRGDCGRISWMERHGDR